MPVNQFASTIKRIDPQTALNDPELVRRARELNSTFAKIDKTSILKANRQRADFADYLDWKRLHHGLGAALAEMDRYHIAGTAPRVRAFGIVYLTQRLNAFDERESALERALDENPQDHYVQYQYLLAAQANSHLEIVIAGLETLLLPHADLTPQDRLELAELAAQVGAWDICERHLALLPTSSETQLSLAVYAERIRLSRAYAKKDQNSSPKFMINLPRDSRRMDLAGALFSKMGGKLERQEAVDGSLLEPAEIAPLVRRRNVASPLGLGVIGCALSHIETWKRLLEEGHQHALILEDDAIPYSWQDVDDIAASSPGTDITFVNQRMSSTHVSGHLTGFSEVWDVLGRWPEGPKGWGLDGYIVSKTGAEKLLEFVEEDLIIGHLDGQVGSYCLREGQVAHTRAQKVGSAIRSRFTSAGQLNGAALNFPLIKQLNFGTSTIADASS